MFPALRLAVLLLFPLLAACVSVAPRSDGPPAPMSAVAPAWPPVALDDELLYDILLGEIASQRGQIGVTAETLGRAARASRDPRLAERATLAGIYAKQHNEALRSAQLWVELRPMDTEAREALAVVLLELGRTEEVRVHFEKMLSIAQQQHSLDHVYTRIAAVLSRQVNRPGMLDLMQSLVLLYPRTAAAHFALAHLAVRADDLERADASVARALELRPGWEEAAQFRARILISRKNMTGAQRFYETFLSAHADATATRLSYARFLIDQKQWEPALDQFQRIVTASPGDAEAIYAVGLLSLQTNRLTEADKYLRLALELRPGNDQARLYLGQVAEQRHELGEAARWYSEIGPGEHRFEAQTRLGIVIARRGDLPSARRHLQAIDVTGENQRVQLALAEEQILREAKHYREAYDVLTHTLDLLPGNRDLLYARSLIAEKLNLIDVAEGDLRAILKQDVKNANALNALGYMLADRGQRLDEAQTLLREAMTAKPDDPFILDSYGWLLYRLGQSGEAIRYLRRALELRFDVEISAHLGEVLWVTGDRREAESVWDRALKDTPDNEALLGIIRKFKP